MKKIFRRILNRFGYDLIYLKSRDGSVDDFPFHFKRNLSELKCDLIIDIGANKGQFGKWLFDKVNFEGSLLSFEPLQQMHEQLSLVAKEYKNWKVYDRVALGAEEGEITINVSNLVGNSSVLGMKNTKYNVQNAHYVAQELVPQITLETLNTNEWMKSFKNAFIKIDVQGYELSVIRKLANAKYNVIGFYIELSLITLYENQEDYLEIAGFLKSMNYHLCYLEPESVRHNKMVQFNGLFLKGKQVKDFRFFYQYISNRFFVLVLLSIIVGLLDGFGISMIVPLLATLDTGKSDSTEVDRYQQMLIDGLDRLGIDFTLTSIFLVMLLIFTIKSIAVFAESYYGVSVRAAFMRRVRHKLISGVRLQSYKLFRDSDHNKVQNFLTLESARLGSAILFFFAIIRSAFKILVYVSLALLSSFRFSILVALGALLTNLIYRWTFKKTEAISLRLTAENTSLQGLIKEYISFYKYLRTTSNIDMYAAKADQKSGRVEYLYKKMGFLNSVISSTREFFVLSIIIGVLIIEIQVFHSDVPELIVSLLLFYRGLNAFLSLQTSWNQYLNNAGSVVSIREMLTDFESNRVENSEEEIAFDSSIKIENGSLVYETGSFKIDSINLEIPKNSHVAFIGKSGSGKTTVVDILCGLLLLDKGRLMVDGIELTSDNTRSLSRLISYVGQKPVIFHDSIYNNITLWQGSGDETDKRYKEVVDNVQLGDLIGSFDEQSNTVLSDGGVNLSGGQIQRIALARELYQQRDIIILDEATSALDKESELYLKSVIAKLKGTKTIVQISHSYQLIDNADFIYEMKDGRISKFSSQNSQQLLTVEADIDHSGVPEPQQDVSGNWDYQFFECTGPWFFRYYLYLSSASAA